MRHKADKGQAGYLLVEALVALAIVTAMAGMVFQTVWQTAQTHLRAEKQREAILLARSVLAAASVGNGAAPIAAQGSDGSLAWSWSAEPWSGSDSSSGLALQQVRVMIRDDNGKMLTRFSTLRSAP